MFPNSSTDVAVSHYSNWSLVNWLAAYAVLGLAVAVAALAVAWWITAEHSDGMQLYAGSGLAGLTATTTQAITLWLVARHIEKFSWVVVLALAFVGAVAVAAYAAARLAVGAAHGTGYYAPPAPKLTLAVPVGISGVISVGVIIGDGVTRVAASIPMAVGAFVAVVVVGMVALMVSTNSR